MIEAKDGFVTAAFFMEGLHEAGYDDCIEEWDQGCVELVCELTNYVPSLLHLNNSYGEKTDWDFPGVFDYEVSSPFGKWFGEQIIATGQAPSKELAQSIMHKMVLEFFMQGRDKAEQSDLIEFAATLKPVAIEG